MALINPELIFAIFLDGLVIGLLFALVGMGLTLVFGVLDVLNMAHAGYFILGGYLSLFVSETLGINIYLTIPVTFVLLFVLGYSTQRVLIQRVMDKEQLLVIIFTFGILEVIRGALLYTAGSNLVKANVELPFERIEFFGTAVTPADLVMMIGSVLVAGGLYVFLFKMRIGKAIRATRDNEMAAEVLGVDVPRIYAITMGVSIAVAGVAGAFLVTVRPISTYTIFIWLAYAFVVVILGGLGSVNGALVGGIVLGQLNSFLSYYIGSGVGLSVMFFLMVVVLVIKPTGIMGIDKG